MFCSLLTFAEKVSNMIRVVDDGNRMGIGAMMRPLLA
jgi:hypothetical protein